MMVTYVQHVKAHHIWYIIKMALLFSAYFITATLGLSLDAVSGFAALVWPPTGIALAAILILGYRYWPAIALAALLVNVIAGAPPFVALGIAAGNTLEALLGAYALKRFIGFQNSLERIRDVVGLVLLAAVGSTMVSATIGVTSLVLGDAIPSSAYGATWAAWWIGDMLGALVVAPFLLVWSCFRHVFIPKRFAEAVFLASVLFGVSVFIFSGVPLFGVQPFTLVYVIFPVFVWIALRFGQPGSVSATLAVLLVSIWSTTQGIGPFAGSRLSDSLLLLQSFMGITAVTFMTMAAAVSEQERTLKRQQELMQKTVLLAKQRSRLVAINQAKDEFIYVASHQLRTPATIVKQYIGMLLGNYAGTLSSAQRKMLRSAYDSNEQQIQVINDLLGVAQLDAGNVVLKKDKVDLVVLIGRVVRRQRALRADRNHEFAFIHARGDFTAHVDKKKLSMVLENLIDNAAKYTHPGKKIEVTLTRTPDGFEVAVVDEGIGMAQKDLRRLFKKFSRIDNPMSISVGGTGLGLYWARKVIDLHGGAITVSSKLQQGSTFTIFIPKVKEP